MPSQQQDYILRHIEAIARLIARLRRKGGLLAEHDRSELDEALLLAAQLQERNFGRPAHVFLALPADDQFAALSQSESKSIGHDRCLTYINLLRTTAELYAIRGSLELALGARQHALYIALRIAHDGPADKEAVHGLIGELLHLLDGAELHPPAQELLERLRAQAP